MKRLSPSVRVFLAFLAALVLVPALWAQAPEFKPAVIQTPMADFTLPLYQGGELALSSLKGKNVVIIVPRFWADVGYYCTICDYQYMDIVDVNETQQFQQKHNAAIVFLFPFGKEDVGKWLELLPGQMEKIKAAKNPPDVLALDEKGKARMERWRKLFPKDFSLKPNAVPTPFPIMLDPERKVTGPLGVFSTDWNGSKVDQGIPSVFILNAQGTLMFKYISQNTVDRPSPEYLGKVLDMINSWK
jgi:peroxiredoxin